MGDWTQIGPEGNRGYLAAPEGGRGPGVLVLHAWWGLTPVFTDVCDRLAAEGYVALAPSLYPDGVTTASIAEAEKLVEAHDSAPDVARTIVQAATDHLLAMPEATGERIGVLGFLLGAYWALNLSQVRPDDVSAVVALYGTDDGDYSTSQAAYLGHFAESDDFEPLEAVRALEARIRAAGREVEFHIYPDTGHWFIESARRVYGEEPAIRPTGDASGRQGAWFATKLGVPGAASSVGPPDWRGHAANEFMTLGHFINGVKFAATIYTLVGEQGV